MRSLLPIVLAQEAVDYVHDGPLNRPKTLVPSTDGEIEMLTETDIRNFIVSYRSNQRVLHARWSFATAAWHSISAEVELTQAMATDISEQIDLEILQSLTSEK